MVLYILDTDHLSLLQRGHAPLKAHVQSISPKQIAMTVISAEEMLLGRLAQIRRAKNASQRIQAYAWLDKTLAFLGAFELLPYDATAEQYFENLRAQNLRVGSQDLRIAAIALSGNASVVTRNQRDFERVPNLSVSDWSV